MIVRFSSSFKRTLRKLTEEQHCKVDAALQLFVQTPFDPQLQNHKLHGDKKGLRSIAAGYDLRVLYRTERDASIAILLMVGTHDEVY